VEHKEKLKLKVLLNIKFDVKGFISSAEQSAFHMFSYMNSVWSDGCFKCLISNPVYVYAYSGVTNASDIYF
jgi:hypothetical protein